jgi:hypothetical protein
MHPGAQGEPVGPCHVKLWSVNLLLLSPAAIVKSDPQMPRPRQETVAYALRYRSLTLIWRALLCR